MNEMSIKRFYDFYMLEAMRAGMAMAKSDNPEIAFKHSFEKLEADVNKAFDELTDTMSKRIRLYMWAACLGEGRHGGRVADMKLTNDEIDGEGRGFVFSQANNYPIDQHNLDVMTELFDAKWRGSYGGKKWGAIVEAIALFDEVSPATFIDHAIDLEHNGGNIFNKSDGRREPVKLENDGLYQVRSFLDDKFRYDILTCGVKAEVTQRTMILLDRYRNVVNKNAVYYRVDVSSEWFVDAFDVEYGEETLDIEDSEGGWQECAFCSNKIDPDEHYHSPDDDCICEDCYDAKYATCENCGDLHSKYDLEDVDGNDLCEDCIQTGGWVKCENCGDWTQDYIVTEDNSEYFCEECAEKCEECDEYYSDLEWHKEHEHAEEEEKREEKEANEHAKHAGQWILQYDAYQSIKKFDTYAEAALFQTKDGGEVIKSTLGYQYMTYNLNGKVVTGEVYKVSDGLWAIDLKKDYKKIGKKHTEKRYGIMTLTGNWFGAAERIETCVHIANELKDMYDWENIKMYEWKKLDQDKKDAMNKIIHRIQDKE